MPYGTPASRYDEKPHGKAVRQWATLYGLIVVQTAGSPLADLSQFDVDGYSFVPGVWTVRKSSFNPVVRALIKAGKEPTNNGMSDLAWTMGWTEAAGKEGPYLVASATPSWVVPDSMKNPILQDLV